MIIKKLLISFVHFILKIIFPLIKIPTPKVINESGGINNIPKLLEGRKPFIICTPSINKTSAFSNLLENLKNSNIKYTLFTNVSPNPTNDLAYAGKEEYLKDNCSCLISIGGGSAIDLAKLIGALLSHPKKDFSNLKGVFKLRHKLPFHIAVPTTVGSGSETTLAAVIIIEKTKDKFAISDPKLVPNYAILDEQLITTLPKNIISTTGMDNLTHSIESFLSKTSTRKTKNIALNSIKLLNENLLSLYKDGSAQSRSNMLYSSFLAGLAFTRTGVGYVHALSHSLGGKFNYSHGLANAILLPVVLKAYGKKIYPKLSIISDSINLTSSDLSKKEKALALISWIESLNLQMDIPTTFSNLYTKDDIRDLVKHALKEANPFYAVPKIFGYKDLERIYLKLM